MFFRQFMRTRLSIRASRKLHDSLLDSVMAAPMSFFHTTPQGRVLNRFSNDVGTVRERITAFPCAPAAILPKAHAFVCGAAGR